MDRESEELMEMNRKVCRALKIEHRVMQESEYDQQYEHGFAVTGWVSVYDCDEMLMEIFPANWSTDLNAAWDLWREHPKAIWPTIDRYMFLAGAKRAATSLVATWLMYASTNL